MRVVYQKVFGPVPDEMVIYCRRTRDIKKGDIVLVFYRDILMAMGKVYYISTNLYYVKINKMEEN